MKKTKIVCTMGPNTDNREIMKELALNGMDVARFNFSHGDHAEHRHRLEILESVREELGIPIASLLDTKGPEIRLRHFEGGKVYLEAGQKFTLTGNPYRQIKRWKESDAERGRSVYSDDRGDCGG